MSKIFKTILAVLMIMLGTAAADLVLAQPVKHITVEFEKSPLFKEANFLPGDGVARWVKIANNDAVPYKIGVQTTNESDPDNFAQQFDITIKSGSNTLFTGTLRDLFDAGEKVLSEVPSLGQIQYDLTATFKPESGDDYQGKILGFDIEFGIAGEGSGEEGSGEEGGGGYPTYGGTGGGGGAVIIEGLVIKEETIQVINITQTTATILWHTSLPATGRIIYSPADGVHILDLGENSGTLPFFGYDLTSMEYPPQSGVTGHTIILINLKPDTVYFFRPVATSPLAVGQERSFKTLPWPSGPGTTGAGQQVAGTSTGPQAEGGDLNAKNQGNRLGFGTTSGQGATGTATSAEGTAGEGGPISGSPSLLANIASFFGRLSGCNLWSLLLLLLLLVILYLLYRQWAKKKDEKRDPKDPPLRF